MLEAPTKIRLPDFDVERQSFVEIRDRRTRQVVTVIELLSPSNKRAGRDREQYLQKRAALLSAPSHFIEIDLLRGGARMPMADLPDCDYCVMVSRAEVRPVGGCWPISLTETLPTIPVPLHAPDPDARLDLQQLVHRIYDAARYGAHIYEGAPDPPLTLQQRAWADAYVPAGT